MSVLQAILLGIVQESREFLPEQFRTSGSHRKMQWELHETYCSPLKCFFTHRHDGGSSFAFYEDLRRIGEELRA